MTLADAIRAAVDEPDHSRRKRLVREVADTMRFRLRWNYAQSAAAVAKVGVDADRWEELLYEADFED